MHRLLIALFLLCSLICQAQTYSPEEVKQDLIQLKESIETYNPALALYYPEFKTKAEQLISEVSAKPLTAFDSFKLISRMSTLSHEGHFSVGTWEDEVHAGFLSNEFKYMPLSLTILDGRILVWLDISRERELNSGDEILSINGISAADILAEFALTTPSDGDIHTYRRKIIDDGFTWMYYLFIERSESFTIETKSLDGAIKKTQIQAITRKEQFENFGNYYPERVNATEELDAFYSLEFEGKSAILTLPSFDFRRVNKYEVKSKKFYKDLFDEIASAKVENLIVDLRDNTGGRSEFASDISPYILKDGIEQEFLKKTTSWEGKTRTYAFPKPAKTAFKGNIYVLINGKTYSAGNTLTRVLKELGNAVIIGEESGTRYEGFVAGSQQEIILTNSQIKIGIPRYHITFPKSEKQTTRNRGTLPDYEIKPTFEDLWNKRDLHMEKVKNLIDN